MNPTLLKARIRRLEGENAKLRGSVTELAIALKTAVQTTYSDMLHEEWSALLAKALPPPPTEKD